MKIQVIQDEFQGIPNDPELFTSEEKALECFKDKAEEMGFRAKHKDEEVTRYLQRFNDWYTDKDKEDALRWWEIDMPTPFIDKMKEVIMLIALRMTLDGVVIKKGDRIVKKLKELVIELAKK